MQLFAMSPFITLLFWHYGVAALALVTLLTIGSIVANTIVVHDVHIQTCEKSLQDLTRPLDQYDTEPWIRAVPYLFGITLAFFYNAMGEFSNGSQVVSRPLTRFVTYLIMVALLSLPIFATVTLPGHEGTATSHPPHSNPLESGDCKWNSASSAAYLSLYRLSWSLGLFILAGTCMIGWNSPISKLLGARAWSPFSRLVYGVYLVIGLLKLCARPALSARGPPRGRKVFFFCGVLRHPAPACSLAARFSDPSPPPVCVSCRLAQHRSTRS